jgi:hypothetical protein
VLRLGREGEGEHASEVDYRQLADDVRLVDTGIPAVLLPEGPDGDDLARTDA